jgi:hypothetical protein
MLWTHDHADHRNLISTVKDQLDPKDFESAWDEGQGLQDKEQNEIIDYALEVLERV